MILLEIQQEKAKKGISSFKEAQQISAERFCKNLPLTKTLPIMTRFSSWVKFKLCPEVELR